MNVIYKYRMAGMVLAAAQGILLELRLVSSMSILAAANRHRQDAT